MSTPPPSPAGWYADPQGPPGQQRWWDGQQWTDRAAAKKSEGPDAWLMSGIVFGLLFPIVGFIFAVILFAKGRTGHGIAALLCCILGFFVGAALLYG